MRRSVRAGLVAIAVVVAASCTPPPLPTRVLVIGLDGATWTIAEPMLAAGELPQLARLIARGVRATPVAAPPLLAPVVWTTGMTGVVPAQHGVEDAARAGSDHRKVPALWSRADAAGKTSVLVNVPGTWPAERLTHGIVVADVGRARAEGGGAGRGAFVDVGAGALPPPYDGLANLLRLSVAPLAPGTWSNWIDVIDPAIEPSVLRVKRLDGARAWVSPLYVVALGASATAPPEIADELAQYLGMPYVPEGPAWSAYGDDEVPDVFVEHLAQTTDVQLAAVHYLLKRKPWDLFVWIDPLPDRMQHAFWGHPERVRAAYREADRHLGEFLARAPGSWVVVVSAHGFGDSPGGGRADHASAGLLVVAGPGLRGDAGEIPLLDVGPTVACLLDLPREGMTGTPLPAVVAVRPGCG